MIFTIDDGYTFGTWLKRQRKRLRLTQRELAETAGYAEVTLRKVEADELRPSHAMAQRLAEVAANPRTRTCPIHAFRPRRRGRSTS